MAVNKIEQCINELEEYIENCKFVPMSSSRIMVNKDEIDELISNLRANVPEEIKKYKKIINNKDTIINSANEKANDMIREATAHINELVSEHEIMQQAYARASEVVESANQQAGEILDQATVEANQIKTAAVTYTDERLSEVQGVLTLGMQQFGDKYENMMNHLQEVLQVVVNNRNELYPQEEPEVEEPAPDVNMTEQPAE
ncbi:MAG: vacuolar family H+-ATPase subunit H [Lachnospiraceae bacterium]|nr:vacuolar family H+-ATPase subunit H [Lachnospiraceae bacterium]